MKRIISAAAVAVALISPSFAPTPAMAQRPSNPQIEIIYGQAKSPNLQAVADRVKKRQVLEELSHFLVPIKLPKKLTVQFDQCGAQVRIYKAGGPATVCYELVEQIEKVAARAEPDMREMVLEGPVTQAVFHEVANAIFDILQVPVWGRREDAADRLGGFIMVEFGDEVAYNTIIGTAIFFGESGKTWTGSMFADVNSPEAQRYYNFLCMAYGADSKTFGYLAKSSDQNKDPVLPERRAGRCRGEYEQVRRAFYLRIMPFVDPDLLTQSRATLWSVGGGKQN